MKLSPILIKRYFLIMIFSPMILCGQDRSDEFKLKRANSLYQAREFDQSLILYRELYNKNTNNTVYFQKYLTNLIQVKEYADAIKILEFKLLQYPNHIMFRNQLAQLYFKKQNKDKAFEIWNELLNGPTIRVHEYSQIASTMISERLLDKAIEVYEMAQIKLKNPSLFLPTIARLYSFGFNYKKAFEVYLLNLKYNSNYLNTTRRQLLQIIERPEAEQAILESMDLIDRDNPDHLQIEVAIYMHSKKFDDALKILTSPIFKQSKTLLDFGNDARKLGEFDLAERAYNYILDNYDKTLHFPAFQGLLETKISLSHTEFQKRDSINQVIDDLYLNSEYKNEISTILLYNSHLLTDRFDSKYVINSISKLTKTVKLQQKELNEANQLLAKAYFYNRDFNQCKIWFERVPENYKLGEKYLFLSAIELLTEKKNVDNLNQILKQKNGLTNPYLNDAIKILLLLNNNLKSEKDITLYAESFYHTIIGKNDLALEYLDQIKINERFEIEKDRVKFEIYKLQQEDEKIMDLLGKNNSPEWVLKKAKYQIYKSQYNEAIATLNSLIINSPNDYYAIEARRLIREI